MVNLLKTPKSGTAQSVDAAESIGVAVFGFLAGEPEYLANFSTQTGVEISVIPEIAESPAFLHAVLGFVLSDQSLLLACCQSIEKTPQTVDFAFQKLEKCDAER